MLAFKKYEFLSMPPFPFIVQRTSIASLHLDIAPSCSPGTTRSSAFLPIICLQGDQTSKLRVKDILEYGLRGLGHTAG